MRSTSAELIGITLSPRFIACCDLAKAGLSVERQATAMPDRRAMRFESADLSGSSGRR
jgi:hypothetical protein